MKKLVVKLILKPVIVWLPTLAMNIPDWQIQVLVLEAALQEARKNTESFSILDVHIGPEDRSLALQRLTDALGKRVKG